MQNKKQSPKNIYLRIATIQWALVMVIKDLQSLKSRGLLSKKLVADGDIEALKEICMKFFEEI